MMKTAYSKEPLDFRLMVLISLRRVRWVVYGVCIGAILFGGLYYLARNVLNEADVYSVSSDIYVEYSDEIEANESYINMQTWASLAHNDYVDGYASEYLSKKYLPETLESMVTATLLTSNQIVTVTAESTDPKEAEELANAYAKAIEKFAPQMKEVDSARIIKTAKNAKVVGFEDRTWAMVCVGAIVGFVMSVLGVMFYFAIDDSVHVPGVIETRYGIPAMGITTDNMRKLNMEVGDSYLGSMTKRNRKKTEFYRQWLQVNYVKLTKGKKKVAVVGTSLGGNTEYISNLLNLQLKDLREREIFDIDRSIKRKEDAFYSSDEYELTMLESVNQNPEAAMEAAKYDAVIVLIKASDHNGKLIERALDILRVQEANVVGAILYDTNASLIKQYVFSPFCSSTKKLKEDIYNARNASDIVAPK